MNTDAAQARVHQVQPGIATRAVSTLDRVDYEDAFIVDVARPAGRDAEQWMRVILEDAPMSTRLRLQSAWSAIGLKLNLSSSVGRSVLGWEIRSSEPDYVVLGVESRIGMPGELLLRRLEHELLFATLVRFDNPIARALWATIETAHVRTVRSILELASRRAD